MDNNLTNDINTSTAPAQTTVSDADITAAAFNDMMAPLTNAAPTLTLEPAPQQPAEETKPEPVAEGNTTAQMQFTPEEQQVIDQFAQQIDLTNSNQILYYGSDSQKKIADFSENALAKVRTNDLGEVGSMISSLTAELKNFSADEEESKGFFGLFKKQATNSKS